MTFLFTPGVTLRRRLEEVKYWEERHEKYVNRVADWHNAEDVSDYNKSRRQELPRDRRCVCGRIVFNPKAWSRGRCRSCGRVKGKGKVCKFVVEFRSMYVLPEGLGNWHQRNVQRIVGKSVAKKLGIDKFKEVECYVVIDGSALKENRIFIGVGAVAMAEGVGMTKTRYLMLEKRGGVIPLGRFTRIQEYLMRDPVEKLIDPVSVSFADLYIDGKIVGEAFNSLRKEAGISKSKFMRRMNWSWKQMRSIDGHVPDDKELYMIEFLLSHSAKLKEQLT